MLLQKCIEMNFALSCDQVPLLQCLQGPISTQVLEMQIALWLIHSPDGA